MKNGYTYFTISKSTNFVRKKEMIKFTHKYLDATFSLENEPILRNLRKIYKRNIDLLLAVQMDKLLEIPYQL